MLVNGSRGVVIGFETDIDKILLDLMNELELLKKCAV